MAFTSVQFLLFVVAVVLVYYVVPKRIRWLALLAASASFYILCNSAVSVVLLLTVLTVWLGALRLQSILDQTKAALAAAEDRSEKNSIKAKAVQKKRMVLLLVCLLNFGQLALFKYVDVDLINFVLSPFARLLRMEYVPFSELAMPLGISFYTFQAIGYLVDVYRGKQPAEKNPLRVALFLSFFPQIVQGPISRYNQLAPQLFEGHELKFDNLKEGILLIGWGFVKKLLLADRLAVLVEALFKNYVDYGGAMLFVASVCYGLQVYTDFSAGMNITRGVARMLGIDMVRNFRQPYYATSISDYWRRWHITLGSWMRDYLFYPLSLSKPFGRLGKWSRQKWGPLASRVLVSGITSFIVFTVVGIWHGSDFKYTVFGFYNGILIMLATICEPVFEKLFAKTGIDREGKDWHAFRVVRTFFLCSLGRCIGRSTSVMAACVAFKRMITQPNFAQLTSLLDLGLTGFDFGVILLVLILVFFVDWLEEYQNGAYEWLQKRNILIRWLAYLGIIFLLLMFIPTVEFEGGFIYAKF